MNNVRNVEDCTISWAVPRVPLRVPPTAGMGRKTWGTNNEYFKRTRWMNCRGSGRCMNEYEMLLKLFYCELKWVNVCLFSVSRDLCSIWFCVCHRASFPAQLSSLLGQKWKILVKLSLRKRKSIFRALPRHGRKTQGKGKLFNFLWTWSIHFIPSNVLLGDLVSEESFRHRTRTCTLFPKKHPL